MNIPSREDIVRRLLPLDEYRDIRDDMVDIYIAAFYEYPPASDAFGKFSIPQLQDKAGENAVAALNYDPAAAVGEVQQIINRFLTLVKRTLVLVFLISVVSGISIATTWSREALELITTLDGILISAILGSSTLVGAFAAFVLVYVWLLSLSSTVISVMNEELVYGPREYKTRAHTRLVGYTIWNSSLDGSGAVKLLLIFSILKVLSAVPGWDPYTYIKRKVQSNMDIWVDADGFIDAWGVGFRRLRKLQHERRQEEREFALSTERNSRKR